MIIILTLFNKLRKKSTGLLPLNAVTHLKPVKSSILRMRLRRVLAGNYFDILITYFLYPLLSFLIISLGK
jgi:hypothetical protein